METLTETAVTTATKRKRPQRKLKGEEREQLIAYFMAKYPFVLKIKTKGTAEWAYGARAYYKQNGIRRTFRVRAYKTDVLYAKFDAALTERQAQMSV